MEEMRRYDVSTLADLRRNPSGIHLIVETITEDEIAQAFANFPYREEKFDTYRDTVVVGNLRKCIIIKILTMLVVLRCYLEQVGEKSDIFAHEMEHWFQDRNNLKIKGNNVLLQI